MKKLLYILIVFIFVTNSHAKNNLVSEHANSCPLHIATDNELRQLQASTHPLNSFNPGTKEDDLASIKTIIGNATVVGLGEGTHGTHEFFKMKHRLIEYLVKNMGFTIFAIEANMPEAYQLNDYILDGRGNPKKLIAGMHFWTWSTQEVLDMVLWMHDYNQTATNKILFAGFDMQASFASTQIVAKDLVKSGFPRFAENLKKITPELLKWESLANALTDEDKKIKFIKTSEYLDTLSIINKTRKLIDEESLTFKKILGEKEYKWLKQNVLIIYQSYTSIAFTDRDKAMATNVIWIKSNNPRSKIILWAHNGHVSNHKISMGGYLAKELKDDYRSIGLATLKGQYTALALKNGKYELRRDNILSNAPDGSFEGNLKLMKTPLALIDFTSIKKSKLPKFLLDDSCWRARGALNIGLNFMPQNLSQGFDAIIYIEKTTASQAMN